MASTYTSIATTTLGSAASSITLSSIPSSYTDLVVVFVGANASADDFILRFNSDSTGNYSTTQLVGDGTSVQSIKSTSVAQIQLGYGTTNRINSAIINVFNYANTSTYKTSLIDYINTNDFMRRTVALYRSTAAINSITIQRSGAGNMNAGTSMTIYGILKA
jgi:hypothetical protein